MYHPSVLCARTPRIFLFLLVLAHTVSTQAQVSVFDSVMQWRCIGPFRGGRSLAVAGNHAHRLTY
ncbi:MAG: hypothetical protein ACKOB6_01020 [Candidatus Kapaibacterium sp.]